MPKCVATVFDWILINSRALFRGFISDEYLLRGHKETRFEMNGFLGFIATTVAAFLLVIGVGKSECISECFGNGNGMQCGSCDSPKDGDGKVSSLPQY
jgi:hypothetical protein